MVILYKGMAIILTSGPYPVSGGPVVFGMIMLTPGGVSLSKKKKIQMLIPSLGGGEGDHSIYWLGRHVPLRVSIFKKGIIVLLLALCSWCDP